MIRAFLVLALSTASAAPAVQQSDKMKATVDFFEGTLKGFFDSDTFPDVQTCLAEAETSFDGIKEAIDEIEQKTAASVKKGLHDLGEALEALKKAMVDCKASTADVQRFVKALEDGFKKPLSFLFHLAKHCLVNGKEIYSELTAASADWKAEQYRAAGEQIGAALAKVLQPDFDTWKDFHGKTYASEASEAAARAAYELNADLASAAHLQRAEGVHYHLNEFADLSPAAFNQRNGLLPSALPRTTARHVVSGAPLPASVWAPSITTLLTPAIRAVRDSVRSW